MYPTPREFPATGACFKYGSYHSPLLILRETSLQIILLNELLAGGRQFGLFIFSSKVFNKAVTRNHPTFANNGPEHSRFNQPLLPSHRVLFPTIARSPNYFLRLRVERTYLINHKLVWLLQLLLRQEEYSSVAPAFAW